MQTKKEVATPYNDFKNIIEIKRVGARGLIFNKIKYDHK
jgi:hypothetical protein